MDTKTMIVSLVGTLCLFALLATPVACTMNRQRLVAEAIKAGADPLAAKCAIEGDQGDSRTSALCMATALRK
jgi:hypothetical protein